MIRPVFTPKLNRNNKKELLFNGDVKERTFPIKKSRGCSDTILDEGITQYGLCCGPATGNIYIFFVGLYIQKGLVKLFFRRKPLCFGILHP